ncbi:regulator of nonsense transcripts 3B isoform X2 [Lathamus discolor]|uniref:regulator of nonsense transcripts 3B isoform X2 n=1 Tax=Lathamus discolor TaxID=678569 RepID=UPI0032B76CE8
MVERPGMARQTPMMAMPGRISYHIPPLPCCGAALPHRRPGPLRALPARPAPPSLRAHAGGRAGHVGSRSAAGPRRGGLGRGRGSWPFKAQSRGRRWPGMKEDKENARPKERRGAATGLGALLGAGTATAGAGDGRTGAAELDRLERPKDKKETLSKVVIRRLPPSLTKEQLEEHLQPLPEHDYFEFFANDSSLYPHMFSRAYINFKNQEDIVLFRDRFDGYVFVDHKGQEYAAIVEFAPFQKAAKKKSKKKDAKTGTIEDDPEYKKFLESYGADDEKLTSTPETLLEEIEARNKELIAKKTTPLLNFLKNKQRLREEKREERRRRELERKRQREEERRKWKEEERRKRKEAEKLKKVDRCPEKERDRSKEEPKIKLLKKPEKDEKDLERKEKSKKLEKETLREEKNASSASAKRSDGETKEEKAKKIVQQCSCTSQEPEAEADCVSMKTVLQSLQIRVRIRNKRVR